MFRKFFVFVLLAVMCVAMTACSGSDNNETAGNNNTVSAAAVEVTPEPVVTPEPFEPIDWETVAENPASDFTYHVFDNRIVIDSYIGTNPVVRIPATIDDMPVGDISEDAFRENIVITHIYMPDSLTRIWDRAFLACTSLKQVRLSEDTFAINPAVFKDCTELRVINMPAAISRVDNSAFANCTMLTEAVFGENMTFIGENAFAYCTSLVKISAPAVTRISQMAFVDCPALADLTINGGCSMINGNSFNGCTALQTVTLTEVPEDYEYSYLFYENGVLYTDYEGSDGPTAMRMFPGTPVEELVLRDDTIRIDHSAFYGCQMKSVVIPATVGYIDGNAFKSCPNLETVILQEGSVLGYVSGYIFERCDALKTVDLSAAKNEFRLYDNIFFLDTNLEKVVLPENAIFETPVSEMFEYSENIVVTYKGVDYTYAQLAEVPVTIEGY